MLAEYDADRLKCWRNMRMKEHVQVDIVSSRKLKKKGHITNHSQEV